MTEPAMTRTLELVKKAQGGDRDALNRLFARYYERVRRSVRARLGAHLRLELESGDILNQTFAKAFEKFDHFEMRDEGSLIHWLAKIAEGQIRDIADHKNAKKRTPPGPLVRLDAPVAGGSAPIGANLPDGGESVIGSLLRQNEAHALEECLDALPPHYRDVIVLREFDGLEWTDVAEKAGRPSASAAREMYRQARLELARLLRQRGFCSEN